MVHLVSCPTIGVTLFPPPAAWPRIEQRRWELRSASRAAAVAPVQVLGASRHGVNAFIRQHTRRMRHPASRPPIPNFRKCLQCLLYRRFRYTPVVHCSASRPRHPPHHAFNGSSSSCRAAGRSPLWPSTKKSRTQVNLTGQPSLLTPRSPPRALPRKPHRREISDTFPVDTSERLHHRPGAPAFLGRTEAAPCFPR